MAVVTDIDYATENAAYLDTKADPIAGPILAALHEQDACTYNGNSGGIDERARVAAAAVTRAVEKAIAARLVADAEDIAAYAPSPLRAVQLVAFLLDGKVRLSDG